MVLSPFFAIGSTLDPNDERRETVVHGLQLDTTSGDSRLLGESGFRSPRIRRTDAPRLSSIGLRSLQSHVQDRHVDRQSRPTSPDGAENVSLTTLLTRTSSVVGATFGSFGVSRLVAGFQDACEAGSPSQCHPPGFRLQGAWFSLFACLLTEKNAQPSEGSSRFALDSTQGGSDGPDRLARP